MPEHLISEIATQVPALIVMAYIVVIFLKRLKESETFFRDMQNNSTNAIRDNSKMLGEVVQAIRKCNRNGNH